MAASDQFVEQTTSAALEEKAKLQKHFNRFDIYFFLICTIVGVDTLGQVASDGAQGFLWLVFLAIFFFVPYALLTAELGAAFTEEGGVYVWTRMALGRLVAAINAVFYWFSNPIWIGATLALLAVSAIQTYFWHFSDKSVPYYVIGLAYIWFSVWSAILSFGVGKWIPTLGAWCRIVLIGFFAITTIIYGIEHGLHFPAASEFKPTWSGFILLTPILFFNYVGFELPNAAGDEMKDAQKDVPFTVLRACITSMLLYGLPILAILAVVPSSKLSGVGGFLDAVAEVFTVYGGAASILTKLAAAGFILAVVSSACTWLMGSDRSQAVACYDGAGPRSLGNFSAKFGTPINVNCLSGILSTIVFLIAVNIGNGSAASSFEVMISVVLTFTTISYIVIFPCLALLRRSHPDVHRPYRVPFGMAGVWICTILCTFWAVFASIVAIFPGFLVNGNLLDNATLAENYGVSRLRFETISFTAIIITLIVGILFYMAGKSTRDSMVTVPIEGNEDLASGGIAPAVGD